MVYKDLSGTKSNKLVAEFREIIEKGEFKPGDRFYSQTELCSMFGVSHITVRDAIGTLVAEGYLQRIQGKGTYVLQRDEPAIKKVVGLVLLPNSYVGCLGGFYSVVFDGIYERLAEMGYALQVLSLRDYDSHLPVSEQIPDKDIQGMLVLDHHPDEVIRAISAEYPTVTVDKMISDGSVDAVVTDNRGGGFAAVSHLLDLGHRRIAFIDAWHGAASVKMRYAGYEEALESRGISPSPELVVKGSDHVDMGYSAMKQLLSLKEPPTAVFTQKAWLTATITYRYNGS